jgi:hypothetical protein
MRRFVSLASLSNPVPSTPSPAPTSTPTSSHSSAPSPVDLFKRGIKRDPSVYPTLKDELWNDNWTFPLPIKPEPKTLVM